MDKLWSFLARMATARSLSLKEAILESQWRTQDSTSDHLLQCSQTSAPHRRERLPAIQVIQLLQL